jgi:hypothetical protein
MAESAVLSLAGIVVGIALAALAVKALASMAPLAAANFSTLRGALTAISLGSIALDGRAMVAAVVVAVFTAVVAGLVPAVAATRFQVADVMRQGGVATPAFSGLRRLTSRGGRLRGSPGRFGRSFSRVTFRFAPLFEVRGMVAFDGRGNLGLTMRRRGAIARASSVAGPVLGFGRAVDVAGGSVRLCFARHVDTLWSRVLPAPAPWLRDGPSGAIW